MELYSSKKSIWFRTWIKIRRNFINYYLIPELVKKGWYHHPDIFFFLERVDSYINCGYWEEEKIAPNIKYLTESDESLRILYQLVREN